MRNIARITTEPLHTAEKTLSSIGIIHVLAPETFRLVALQAKLPFIITCDTI